LYQGFSLLDQQFEIQKKFDFVKFSSDFEAKLRHCTSCAFYHHAPQNSAIHGRDVRRKIALFLLAKT
jgi:hypothetical protein